MAETLKDLPASDHPNLLVGYNQADDAGVYKINDSQALVQTVDFFPPIVDDPYQFGRIAAANALSDVYAMGGKPLTALNIVAFPMSDMPGHILSDILRGGAEKVNEAGAVVVGGHSIKDKELKYGIAVTGMVDPNRVIANSGAKVGDLLYLTKPLGTGLVTTAIKRNAVDDSLITIVTELMAELNKTASVIMVTCGVKAATDITGFGLLGHVYEMAAASNVTIRLAADKLPLLPEVLRLASEGMIPGGAISNREYLNDKVVIADSVDKNIEHVMYDPQTSGGLLIAIPAERAVEFEQELAKQDAFGCQIGSVEEKADPAIIVE